MNFKKFFDIRARISKFYRKKYISLEKRAKATTTMTNDAIKGKKQNQTYDFSLNKLFFVCFYMLSRDKKRFSR